MPLSVTRVGPTYAPMMLLYGGEGLGKTTLGGKCPAPLFFDLEHGIPRGMEVDAVSNVGTHPQMMAALKDIYATEDLPYQTVVIDGLEVVESFIHKQACTENHWQNMESASFGKAYVAADVLWRQLLGALSAVRKKHGVTIILIGHQAIERVEDPRVPAYTAYAPRLHKRARSLVVDACDIAGFLAHDLRVVNEDLGFNRERARAMASPARYLFLEGRPAFTAKNRYGMPEKVEITKDFDIRTLTKLFLPQEQKSMTEKATEKNDA